MRRLLQLADAATWEYPIHAVRQRAVTSVMDGARDCTANSCVAAHYGTTTTTTIASTTTITSTGLAR
jgi:hypothetical protein